MNTKTMFSIVLQDAGIVWIEFTYYSDSIGSLVDDNYFVIRDDSLKDIISGTLVANTT